MNTDCYFCAGTGLLASTESCPCTTGECKCHNCLNRYAYKKQQHYNYKDKQFAPHKQDGPMGHNPEWKNHASNIKKKPKPDPATVEAELQLEEELWES